jgi:DNA-binding transcriptional ArsR family regulator
MLPSVRDDHEVPVRVVSDPKMLRAIAHPARIRLLEELAYGGPATATELAERVGESPANCSWHLRQLARYGYVEEAPGGTGRQRPWRVAVQRNYSPEESEDGEFTLALTEATELVYGREYEAMRAARAALPSEPPEWREAFFTSQSMGWLTADELKQASAEILAIHMRYLNRVNDPASRPPGARPIRFVAWGVPARPYKADPDQAEPDEARRTKESE